MGAITTRTLNMRVIPTPTVYTRLLGALGTASSSGSVVAEIRVNGVWKARVTWAQGTTTAPAITYASGSGFSLAAGDTLTVVATSAVTGAADVAITCAAAL